MYRNVHVTCMSSVYGRVTEEMWHRHSRRRHCVAYLLCHVYVFDSSDITLLICDITLLICDVTLVSTHIDKIGVMSHISTYTLHTYVLDIYIPECTNDMWHTHSWMYLSHISCTFRNVYVYIYIQECICHISDVHSEMYMSTYTSRNVYAA